jgi:hypothetical protein
MRVTLIALAGAVALLAGLRAQAPPPTPATAGTGLLLGRVLDGHTTQPVSGAVVTLSRPGLPPQKVIVDGEGRFLFTKLPAGELTLTAVKAGYLNGLSGQRVPGGPGRPIPLADGARVGDAVVRLWKPAAVSGAVYDDGGEPAVGIEVRLVERVLVEGERVLAQNAMPAVVTDDRGIYRFSAVAPGEYILYARSPSDFGPRVLMSLAMSDQSAIAAFAARASQAAASGHMEDLVDVDSSLRVYPPVFYPGTAAPADAQPLGLRAGDERSGVDLHVRPVPVTRVSGTLLHDGKPLAAARVRLMLPGVPIEIATGRSSGDGRFTMLGVPAGAYVLRATRANPVPRTAEARGRGGQPLLPADPPLWATLTVVAGTPEAASLSLAMRPGVLIRGRLEFAGGAGRPAPDEITQQRVTALSADATAMNAVARIEPDGSFSTAGLLPGRYRLRVMGPRPWRAASAMANGVDLLDTPITVESGDLDDVVIAMTDRPGASLDGTIRTNQGTPDPGAVVLILPSDPRLVGARRMRTLRTTPSGAYSAADLPPGDYIVALSSDERVQIGFDREEIARLIQGGTRVTLNDGERRTLDLRSEGGR